MGNDPGSDGTFVVINGILDQTNNFSIVIMMMNNRIYKTVYNESKLW